MPMGNWLDMTIYEGEAGTALFSRHRVITKSRVQLVRCKFCDSDRIFRFGFTRKGEQRYLCRDCERTFVDNRAPIGMRFPTEAIAAALNMFYESASLHKIQRQLQLTYGVCPDASTIYRWVVKYSRRASTALSNVPVKTGSRWVADETVLKVKEKEGSRLWFWDCIDEKTRFLLGSHLSETRGTRDANILMERSARRAGKVPRSVITDKLAAYLDGIELAFGAETRHIQAKKLTSTPGTQLIERFHGTLKDRTKVLRAFRCRSTAKLVMDGWLCHYNFFRPHSSLDGQTPAQAAGADAPFKSWADVVNKGGSK